MAVLATIRGAGLIFASVKGWAYAMSLIPTIAAFAFGLFENRPWSEIILISMATLVFGIFIAAVGVWIWEHSSQYFTVRNEQKRIATQVKEYIDAGINYIDTGTAAGIWAGTLEQGSIIRHLKFRMIKAAINRGDIKNTRQVNDPKYSARLKRSAANKYTHIPAVELKNFFIRHGLAQESDFKD